MSRYVDDDLSVYTRGPALQPEVTLTHEASGCYGSAWGSLGLHASDGDEVDLTVGCELPVSENISIDVAAARYVFRDGGWSVVTAAASYENFGIRAYYFMPDGDEPNGVRLAGSYRREWAPVSATAEVVYDSGGHTGQPDIAAARVEMRYSVAPRFHVSATVQVPLAAEDEDPRGAQVAAAITVDF